MTPPRKKDLKAPFKSLQVVGKKAQNLIARARNSKQKNTEKSDVALPHQEELEALRIHFSILSAVKVTFAILAIVLGAYAVYHLRDKLILLFLGLFVSVLIDPGVSYLEKMKVPRGLGILLHYVVALFLIFFLFFSFIPIIAEQLQSISIYLSASVDSFLADPSVSIPLIPNSINEKLTLLVQSLLQSLSVTEFSDAISQMSETLSSAGKGSLQFLAELAGSVASFFVSLIVVLVLAFFMQIEKETIIQWILSFVPPDYRAYAHHKSEAIHMKISQWARGEALLMLSIFLLTYIALLILGMPNALTLAVLAGFCEFIPAVGPFIAAVPAVFIAITEGGFLWMIIVACVYYVIQWCENNLLVPLIMRRAVGLSPIAILFAMMVGVSFPGTIHPIVGVMMAIPITTILSIFLEDWRKMHEKKK